MDVTTQTTFRILCASCNSVIESNEKSEALREAEDQNWTTIAGRNTCDTCRDTQIQFENLNTQLRLLRDGEDVLDKILDILPNDFSTYEEFITDYENSNIMMIQGCGTTQTLNSIMMRMLIDNYADLQEKVVKEATKLPTHHRSVRYNGNPIHNPYIDFDDNGEDIIELSVDGNHVINITKSYFSENQLEALTTTIDTLGAN